MRDILYTIGHSQHEVGYFVEMLKTHSVNYVIDVRSTPYSQYASNYNRENIKTSLKKVGIEYAYMGKYFGARPEDMHLYTKDGYLDFEKTRKSLKFQNGMWNVIKGIKAGNKVALMCTEKYPIECHRAIMVARTFYEANIGVEHILPDNSLESQEELNEQLMDIYFPDRYQVSLFSEKNKSDEKCLQEAYKLQNRKIGYHLQENVELIRV